MGIGSTSSSSHSGPIRKLKLICIDSFSHKSNSLIKEVIQLNDSRLIFGFKNSEISFRDIYKKKLVANLKAQVSINHLLQFDNEKFLSDSGNFTSYVELWDINTLKSVKKKQPPSNNETQIYSIIQLQNKTIAIGLRNSSIEICSIEPYELIKTISGHRKAVFCLIQMSNGCLVSSSLDMTIRIWEKDTFEAKGVMTDKSIASCIIELKPDRIASCSEDKTIKIWSIESMQCTTVILNKNQSILRIIQVKDNKLIAGVFDHLVVFNAVNWKCETEVKAHSDQIIFVLQLCKGMILSCDKQSSKIWSVKI